MMKSCERLFIKVLIASAISLINIDAVCPQQKRFDFNARIGMVEHQVDKRFCLVISNNALVKDEKVSIVYTGKPQIAVKAVVIEKLSESCSRTYTTADNFTFYSLKVSSNNAGPLGIGVVTSGPVKVTKGKASVDIDGDGGKEYFRECTTNEGVTLTVWKGTPLKGKRVWYQSYYLGYDVEPTCTKTDYEGIE